MGNRRRRALTGEVKADYGIGGVCVAPPVPPFRNFPNYQLACYVFVLFPSRPVLPVSRLVTSLGHGPVLRLARVVAAWCLAARGAVALGVSVRSHPAHG